MKRLLAILLVISLLPVCMLTGHAATYQGQCGNNLFWEVDTLSNKLVIYGSGDMYDYTPESPAPWSQYSNIYTCVIEKGVTGIGSYALQGMNYLGMIHIPETVDRIGAYGVGNARGNLQFYGAVPSQMDDNALAGRTGSLYYLYGWSQADLAQYASHLSCSQQTATLKAQTKILYQKGEKILPEDFLLRVFNTDYSPAYAQIGAYNNATVGLKSVQVTAGGLTFNHQYYVTDGSCHLEDISVQAVEPQVYSGNSIYVKPVVKLGSITLTEGIHYSLSYANNTAVGTEASVTVTGLGALEGYTKTCQFSILRKDISTISPSSVGVPFQSFMGTPVLPEPRVYAANGHLTAGVDFDVTYENHVNIGTATMHIVGKGNYYGSIEKTFPISLASTMQTHTLKGAYMGQADGTLGDQIYYSEKIVSPGSFTAEINATIGNTSHKHVAYYELYRLDGEEMTLLTTYESPYGYDYNTRFTYDFSSVYEGAADTGGEVYLLSYSWVNNLYNVYAGAMALIIPAKVPDGTTLDIDVLPDTDDFRKTYMYAYSQTGNLGNITWSSSDPTIASADGSVITAHRPGTVTITGQYGQLSAEYALTIPVQQLQDGGNVFYNEKTDKVQVSYQGLPLVENTDFTYTKVREQNNMVITITGCGLFTGSLTQSFPIATQVTPPPVAVTIEGISRAKTLLLNDMTYMRAKVAFVDENGRNAPISKEYILENGRILFWKESELPTGAATIANATTVQPLQDAGIYSDGIQEYAADSHGIAATEYSDIIYYRTYLVVNGVEYYGKMNQYSVITYVNNRFSKSDTALKNLLAAMLNYGAAAQINFGYRTDALANAGLQSWVDKGQLSQEAVTLNWDGSLLDIPTAPPASSTASLPQNGAKRTAASLKLEGLIQPKMTFAYNVVNGKGAQLPAGSTVTVYYWSAEDYARLNQAGIPLSCDNVTYSCDHADIQQVYSSQYGYEYTAVLEGIAPRQLGNALYVAAVFTLADGSEYCSGVSVYSPEVYARNQLNSDKSSDALKTLLKWMVTYGENARNYFGNET